MRRSLRFEALRSCKTAMAISSACFVRCVTPRRRAEALYALSARLPPVNQFLRPILHCTAIPISRQRLAAPANETPASSHNQNEPGSRGGFSLYVPEYYTPEPRMAAGDGR